MNSCLFCKLQNALYMWRETSGAAWRFDARSTSCLATAEGYGMGTQLCFPRSLNPTSHKLLVLHSQTTPYITGICTHTNSRVPEAHMFIAETEVQPLACTKRIYSSRWVSALADAHIQGVPSSSDMRPLCGMVRTEKMVSSYLRLGRCPSKAHFSVNTA